MAFVQLHGPNTGTADYYTSPNGNTPRLFADLGWSVSRDNPQSSTLHIGVSGSLFRLAGNYGNSPDPITQNYGPNSSHSSWIAKYHYTIDISLIIGGVTCQVIHKDSSPSTWTEGGYSTNKDNWSFDIDWGSSDNLDVYIQVSGGCYDYEGCDAGNYTAKICSIGVPAYNPYTEPSTYKIDPVTTIGIVGQTEYNSKFTVTRGEGTTIDWIDGKVYPDKSWKYGKWDSVVSSILSGKAHVSARLRDASQIGDAKTVTGEFKYTLPSSGENACTDGAKYKLAVRFSDNHFQWISGADKPIYTYRKPTFSSFKTIDLKGNNVNLFSPQNNYRLSWVTNSRTWTSLEDNFTTSFISDNAVISAKDQEPLNSYNGSVLTSTRTQVVDNTLINTFYNAEARSVAVLDVALTGRRSNLSAGNNYYAEDIAKFQIQYQPTQTPTSVSITAKGKDSSGKTITINVKGKTILIQDMPTISLDWTYPSTVEAAGVVDGYNIYVYSDSKYTTLYKKLTTTSTTYPINSKKDLKRGIMNYIKIVPYYAKPNGKGVIEGTKSYSTELVRPVSRLDMPVIKYPVTNTTWHNKHFRILLQLPDDGDFESLNLTAENYRYRDIELNIQADTESLMYKFSSNPEIFSTTTLSYQKKIAINPSILTTLKDAKKYIIKIRVQKNYNLTTTDFSTDTSWSAWSNPVSLHIQAVKKQGMLSGQKITAADFTYVRSNSLRLRDVYPINPLHFNDIAQSKGDIIDYKEYAGILYSLIGLQQGVNEYCTYDTNRDNIKFNHDITTPLSVPPRIELITAAEEPEQLPGRNYMKLLVEVMNLLK